MFPPPPAVLGLLVFSTLVLAALSAVVAGPPLLVAMVYKVMAEIGNREDGWM